MSEQKPPAGGSPNERAKSLFKEPYKTTGAEQAALLNGERRKAEGLDQGARTRAKLRKFVEMLSNGGAGRAAYVTITAAMPPAADQATWKEDLAFNAADAVLASPDLKAMYSAAIKDGCAIVDRTT